MGGKDIHIHNIRMNNYGTENYYSKGIWITIDEAYIKENGRKNKAFKKERRETKEEYTLWDK
jgi:hypothetical protein